MSFVLKTVFSFEIQYFRGNNDPSQFRRKAKMVLMCKFGVSVFLHQVERVIDLSNRNLVQKFTKKRFH